MSETPATPGEKDGLKIIGAGVGRTGTLSLKVALEELGYGPCYHMSELLKTPQHLALWEAASRDEPIDWNAIFASYQSAVDWPVCSFYEELMQAYPQAKVILTVRDPESWYESASSTIFQMRITVVRFPIVSRLFSLLAALQPRMRLALLLFRRWQR